MNKENIRLPEMDYQDAFLLAESIRHVKDNDKSNLYPIKKIDSITTIIVQNFNNRPHLRSDDYLFVLNSAKIFNKSKNVSNEKLEDLIISLESSFIEDNHKRTANRFKLAAKKILTEKSEYMGITLCKTYHKVEVDYTSHINGGTIVYMSIYARGIKNARLLNLSKYLLINKYFIHTFEIPDQELSMGLDPSLDYDYGIILSKPKLILHIHPLNADQTQSLINKDIKSDPDIEQLIIKNLVSEDYSSMVSAIDAFLMEVDPPEVRQKHLLNLKKELKSKTTHTVIISKLDYEDITFGLSLLINVFDKPEESQKQFIATLNTLSKVE